MKKRKLIYPILLGTFLLFPTHIEALTKQETIYTNLDKYGNIEKVSVTNHLSHMDKEEIEDYTELNNILNINGNETYTLNEDRLTWKSEGRDIYYRGTTEKEQPIKTTIEYYLENEKVNPDDILGKSGKITIKIQFEKQQPTPYVIALGMILNNEENSNISITNGKAVDSGTHSTMIALASPGLDENFKLLELKSLNEITISYETTNFSPKEMYMIATPKFLEEVDLKIFDKLNALGNNLQKLEESAELLEKGTKELETGSLSLVNGSNEITKNLKTALEAIKKLETGSKTMEQEIKKANTLLNQAAASLKDSNISSSITGLSTLKAKNEAAKKALIQTITTTTNMDYQTLMTYYQTNLVNYQGSDPNTLTLKANCELILLLDANIKTYDTLLNKLTPLLKQVEELSSYLSKINELHKGVTELTNGITQVKTGMNKLYEGSKTLTNGINSLHIGVNTLATGMTTFNKEGINTLTQYGKKLTNLGVKAKNTINLSKEYNGFATNNANNSTFVYKIEKN